MELKIFYKAIQDYKKRYENLEYENLEIIFYLQSPVCSLLSMHFDGLLSGLIFQKMMYDYNFYRHILFDETMDIPIPIQKFELKNDYIYKASLIKPMKKIFKTITFKKRFCTNNLDLLQDIRTTYIDRGDYKNRDLPIPYEANLSPLKAYCVGNKEAIENILKLPLSIGKHREKGFGWIKKIKIKQIKKDFSCIKFNKLQRCVPAEFMLDIKKEYNITKISDENYLQNSGIRGEFNYKPPYFHIRDTKLCYLPK